jgi:hypothetical protein
MDFEINIDEIYQFKTVDEFAIWFDTIDEFVEFENVDEFLNELSNLNRPDFYMHVYFFKQNYLKDETK